MVGPVIMIRTAGNWCMIIEPTISKIVKFQKHVMSYHQSHIIGVTCFQQHLTIAYHRTLKRKLKSDNVFPVYYHSSRAILNVREPACLVWVIQSCCHKRRLDGLNCLTGSSDPGRAGWQRAFFIRVSLRVSIARVWDSTWLDSRDSAQGILGLGTNRISGWSDTSWTHRCREHLQHLNR